MKQDLGRLEWIDSLRGIAACLVMYVHFWTQSLRHVPGFFDQPLVNGLSFLTIGILDMGKIGVVLFFAISGFVIPPSLLKPEKAPLRKFVVNRFFRLYPLYWVSVALATMSLLPTLDWPRVIANLTMVQPIFGFHDLLGLYWTLQVELMFYVLCAALCLFGILGNRRAMLNVYGGMLLAAIGMAALRYFLHRKLPVAIPLGLSVMLFGTLWYRFQILQDGSARSMAGIFVALVLALVPISLLAYDEDYGFHETWYRYFLSYVVTVTAFVLFTAWKRITLRPFVYLGKISYSIYLMHATIGLWTVAAFESWWDDGAGAWAAMLAGTAVTIVASSFTYFFIEAPSIRFGRKIARSLAHESGSTKATRPSAGP